MRKYRITTALALSMCFAAPGGLAQVCGPEATDSFPHGLGNYPSAPPATGQTCAGIRGMITSLAPEDTFVHGAMAPDGDNPGATVMVRGPFSGVAGHRDPTTGREFAVICAFNGIWFVDADKPAAASLAESVFFADGPCARFCTHRGVATYKDYVYTTNGCRPGLRVFKITANATTWSVAPVLEGPGDPWILENELGVSGTGIGSGPGPRPSIDVNNGHLYVCYTPADTNNPINTTYRALKIFNLVGAETKPEFMAAWPLPTFDAFVRREYDPGAPATFVDYVYLCVKDLPIQSHPCTQPWCNGYYVIDVTGMSMATVGAGNEWTWLMTRPWRYTHAQVFQGPIEYPHNTYVTRDGAAMLNSENDEFATSRDTSGLTPVAGGGYVNAPLASAYTETLCNGVVAGKIHAVHGIGRTAYFAHFGEGVSIVDWAADGTLTRLAFYDTWDENPPWVWYTLPCGGPADPAVGFDGVWAVAPFQDSGVIYASDRHYGLFMLRADVGHLNRWGCLECDTSTNPPIAPRIVTNNGPARVGRDLELQVENAHPNGTGIMILGTDPLVFAPCPGPYVDQGGALYAQTATTTNALGELTSPVVLPLSVLPFLEGHQVYCQYASFGATTAASSRGTWFGIAR